MRLEMNAFAVVFAIATAMALTACTKQEDAVLTETAAPTEPVDPPALAFVSQLAGPVVIYSLADYSKLGEIAVGSGTSGIGLTDDGQLLAIVAKESTELAIVDTATQKAVRRVPVGTNPEFMRVLGNLAFVALVATEPGQDEIQSPKVAIIDLLTGKKVREIPMDFKADGFEFSADGEHLIVTHADAEKVSVYNIETGEIIDQIITETHGIRPRAVMRSPDGEQFVITLEYGNKLLILDKNYGVIGEVATGEVPYGVTYSRDGSEIVVSLVRGKTVQVFDTETLELKREIPMGEQCLHFSFTPDDLQLIVACSGGNNILVLDYTSGNVIKDIPALKAPWGVLVTPQSAGSHHTPG